MDYEYLINQEGKPYLKVNLTDYALMLNPLLNKGMAFTAKEREQFNLWGVLPPSQINLAIQHKRSYEAYQSKMTDVEKYIYLRDLQDSNETLFYNLLCEHMEELMPIVYTPGVGLGCQRYSHIYRRPRGIFISYPNRFHIDNILANPRFNHVKVIVVSDGERILGLGDQGAGGMGIPIGKLALYTACAGIYPGFTLPILLDSGTDNQDLQHDPLYIGWPHERVRGQEYADFIDQFVTGVKKRFPHILLQWEDFAQQNANPLLERYRNQLCTFNDDIQGTAAVAAGALFAAIEVTKSHLREQRIAVLGGGSAGCGISLLLKQAMIENGMSESEARSRFFIVDKNGLLLDDDKNLLLFQKPFAQSKNMIASWSLKNPQHITLEDVVHNVRPTVLIGVSGQNSVFSENIIREMAKYVERPIIFPLSNPTSRSEAVPSDLLKWSDDRAIIGTGSPFEAVKKAGKTWRVDQTNNCYIFPGMGLGLIAVKAKMVTDTMFMRAAKALAECSPVHENPENNLLPALINIRKVSLHVAKAVAEEALHEGLANFIPPENLSEYLKNYMWKPEYMPYMKDDI
ncbi:MAG TPA: NAD-dependent malic enzyme [Gammaproteobacteria bacterium]|nr:NAD-dependent malic enzyme [Gammaproteobacteria bacterium]